MSTYLSTLDKQHLDYTVESVAGDKAITWLTPSGIFANVYRGASFVCTLHLDLNVWPDYWRCVPAQEGK